MIFAAGLGTRLQPITNTIPKALVPFRGQTLLWYAIQSVVDAGAKRIVVNVHHFADQVIEYLKSESWEAEIMVSDERDELLETGGGLLKAAPLFIADQPILMRNADIVISSPLTKMIDFHRSNKNDVTLAIKKRQTTRYLSFDQELNFCAWKNTKTGQVITVREGGGVEDYGFSGIHVVNYDVLNKLGAQRPFSIIKGYLEIGAAVQIKGWVMPPDAPWFDVGTIDKLKQAEDYYSKIT